MRTRHSDRLVSIAAGAAFALARRAGSLGFILVGAAGCATLVVPPASPAQAQTVYLLDHGRHSSLVLPDGGGRLVRYEYGDWAYFALNRRGSGPVLGALFRSSPAALGRRELPQPVAESEPLAEIRVPIEQAYALEVESAAVEQLRARLEAIYRANRSESVENPRYDLEFVAHPQPYSLRHNSNGVVADWLEALGCRIEGPRRWASWVVRSHLDAQSGSHRAAD